MRGRSFQTRTNDHLDKRQWLSSNKASASDHCSAAANHSLVEPQSGKKLSLEQLLQLCLQSDQDVPWTEFVQRSQPIIARVVTKTIRRWVTPSPNLIDDLVQETYLKLCLNNFKALRQFVSRHENALFGFLKVVGSNTVQDHFRASYSRKRGKGMEEAQLDCAAFSAVLNCPSEDVE